MPDASRAVTRACLRHRRRHGDVDGRHELEQCRRPLRDGGGAHAGPGRRAEADAETGGETDADTGPRQAHAAQKGAPSAQGVTLCGACVMSWLCSITPGRHGSLAHLFTP